MQNFDEEDHDAAASPAASSENERDEPMEDVDDNDGERDGDADADADNDENEDNEENEEDEQDDNQDPFVDSPLRSQSQAQPPRQPANPTDSPTRHSASASSQGEGRAAAVSEPQSGPTSQPNPTVLLTSPSPNLRAATPATTVALRPSVRPEALTATVYDIVPTIAAPHSTSINAVTATPDLRWVFSGGADGYIRKFNWIDTANGKVMLTVAQRHPFVDSVTKAGVLMNYWENEEPQTKSPFLQPSDENLSLSPVYSLAVHAQGLWLLSGLESGGINLQSVRHDEGKRITCLKKHTSAVSVLTLAEDEKSVLSGSWDKNVFDWDLNTGQVKRSFDGSGGQISAIEIRPTSTLPVPQESGKVLGSSDTLMSNANPPLTNGVHSNGEVRDGVGSAQVQGDANENGHGSPPDSLFGGNDADSLFGDDDDEFSRAIANGMQQPGDEEVAKEMNMTEANPSAPSSGLDQANADSSGVKDGASTTELPNGIAHHQSDKLPNGLPHSDDAPQVSTVDNARSNSSDNQQAPSSSQDTFLAASMDGTLRVWDRRQPGPVACILPRNAPPWCMNACWSPDGNSIYAGRRNGTVEEFNLHKGLREADRTFRFPQGSGPVSAVRVMPNGRHLVCASFDILRLYDLKEQQAFKHSTVPFLIVPGHRGGVISSLYIDPTCRYLLSTAGNRGWEGSTTEVMLGYEIGVGR